MKEIKDFSVFDYSGDNIAATTVVNSNKAVKQNLGIYRKKNKRWHKTIYRQVLWNYMA